MPVTEELLSQLGDPDRALALRLKALAPQDRAWVLERLGEGSRAVFSELVTELDTLGIRVSREIASELAELRPVVVERVDEICDVAALRKAIMAYPPQAIEAALSKEPPQIRDLVARLLQVSVDGRADLESESDWSASNTRPTKQVARSALQVVHSRLMAGGFQANVEGPMPGPHQNRLSGKSRLRNWWRK